MTQDELLLQLLQRLDEAVHRYAELDRYYAGRQPLAFLSPEAKTALGNRFGRMASPGALAAAIDDLLTRKPHLASRRPTGDVGQAHHRPRRVAWTLPHCCSNEPYRKTPWLTSKS